MTHFYPKWPFNPITFLHVNIASDHLQLTLIIKISITCPTRLDVKSDQFSDSGFDTQNNHFRSEANYAVSFTYIAKLIVVQKIRRNLQTEKVKAAIQSVQSADRPFF